MFIDKNFSDADAKKFLMKASSSIGFPFKVDNETLVQRFCEGGQSLPLNVGNEWVVRMPRRQETLDEMKFESAVTEVCNNYVHGTEISKVSVLESGGYAFAVHKSINGKTMDINDRPNNVHYSDLSEKQKYLLAKDLASFFAEMHNIPISEKGNIPDRYNNPDKSQNIKYFNEEKAAENKFKLLKYGINLDHYPQKEEDLVCCHLDLHGRNIAIDEKKDHVLQGVFDFGMCCFNKRSADFVKLYTIDRELARKTVEEYNKISPQQVDIKSVDGQFLSWCAENIRSAEDAADRGLISEANRDELLAGVNVYLDNFKNDEVKELEEKCFPAKNRFEELSGRGGLNELKPVVSSKISGRIGKNVFTR